MYIKHSVKKTTTIFIAIAVSSLFFLCIYSFDNKYTYNTSQGVNSLLVLSENDIKNNPVRFLNHGWAFYPGVLLRPTDFKNGDPNYYMRYVSIGSNMSLTTDSTDISPYGSGTYVMHLKLPETVATYALELPEIYSAYRLYVDDKLLLEIGNPDKDTYKDLTQNKIITFEKSGFVTITIAVSNYSHFYGGLVYPPSFGTSDGVNLFNLIRLIITIASITLAIVTAIICFYLGFKMKQQNTLLFSLLCIAMCFFTSYPLLNNIFILPTFPWRTFELTSGIVILLLILILHNRMCNTKPIIAVISNTLVGVFCIITLLFGVFSYTLEPWMIKLYSNLVAYFKFFTATYLIVTSYVTTKKQDIYLKPLLYSSIFFACSCLWDRLLKTYEPIFGGWFMEWGALVLVLGIGVLILHNIIKAYSYNLTFAEEYRQVTRQLVMQKEYSRQIKEYSDENRRITHDFRHHLRTISLMAESSNKNEILTYLTTVTEILNSSKTIATRNFCDNTAVNALLNYYFNMATQKNIMIDIKLNVPNNISLSEVDLCSILGNLLENSIEASELLPQNEGKIFISSKISSQMYFILIENNYDGRSSILNNKLTSRKSDKSRHGIGLQSISKIIERHNGTVEIYPLVDKFRVAIYLPLD